MDNIVNSIDTTPFRFRGENLALDLINTEANVRTKRRDLLENPSEVERWWQFVQQLHPEMVTVVAPPLVFDEHLQQSLFALRTQLRALVTSLTNHVPLGDHALDAVNKVLSTGYTKLQSTGDHFHTVYIVPDSPYGAIEYPIAQSMWNMLTTGDLNRLHKCTNERCIQCFYDTTRSATRIYCSLACLERARSAERYRQSKQSTHSNESED